MRYNKIIIGIDESYKRTGISIVADSEIKSINSIDFQKIKTNSEKRKLLRETLNRLIIKLKQKAEEIVIIVEKIRLYSAGFISEDYIKSIGALIAVMVDTAAEHDIKVYSVDTRSWKSKIVGTSKPQKNKLFVDPKKYPTIKYLIKKGYEEKLKAYLPDNTKIKNYLTDSKGKYLYNDDAADSACIALYGTLPDAILHIEQ
jgi:Holliday junction resolvasome RuvABC endonuclease subunit